MDVNNKSAGVIYLMTMAMLLLLHTTDAYWTGPPVDEPGIGESLCSDMTPGHGGSSLSSSPPYTVTTSAQCYIPAQAVIGKT